MSVNKYIIEKAQNCKLRDRCDIYASNPVLGVPERKIASPRFLRQTGNALNVFMTEAAVAQKQLGLIHPVTRLRGLSVQSA